MKASARVDRVRELLEHEGLDAIVIRSVSDLIWLTGFEDVFDSEQAHIAFVSKDVCIVHTDSRYANAMRAAAADEGLWEVDDTVRTADGAPCGPAGFVARAASACGCSTGRLAIDADMPLSLYRKLLEKLPGARFVERAGDVQALRAVKEPAEIERLEHAQRVAETAFMELLGLVHAGRSECDVALDLEFALRRAGAEELAFSSIVASGPNGANPHAVPGRRLLERGDLVVIDFGARVGGYRSDTTRTIAVGRPSAQSVRAYEAVRAANETVAAAIRPGMTGREAHELAERVLSEHGFAGKMGHGLGHGVGLDIHESPNLSPRNDQPLVAGNVVTVEPGVYIPGACGVRLEDCGVVTEEGFGNFCMLPHALHVVE